MLQHQPPEPLVPLKACSKCGQYQPDTLEFFYQVRGRPGTICLACNRVKCLAYADTHREQARRRMRLWRQAHPERKAADDAQRDRAASNARRKERERAAGGTYSRDQVLARLAQQEGRCHWCGEPLDPTDTHHTTGDHLIPLARGGLTAPDNLVVACLSCNTRRGPKTEGEYRAYLREVARDGAA